MSLIRALLFKILGIFFNTMQGALSAAPRNQVVEEATVVNCKLQNAQECC